MGVAAGANDLEAAHAYAANLTDEQLKAVGCANLFGEGVDRKRREADGHLETPCVLDYP